MNLGRDERKSVEVWPQFVGASDTLAAQHAREFYQHINFNPVVRPVAGAENLKVSECGCVCVGVCVCVCV